MEFEIVKEQFLKAAKEKGACSGEYKRSLNTQSLQELLLVAKENIAWIFNVGMADVSKLEEWFGETLMAENNIFVRGEHNLEAREDIVIVLLDSSQATVKTCGSSQATVETLDSSQATVKTLDSSQATVETLDSSQATVETWGSSQATVETWGGKLTTICSGGILQNRTKKTIEVKKSDYEILIVE